MRKGAQNGGFSLVELIVVMAIMAALVGILAPIYLKYVQKSKVATDVTNADRLAIAVETAIADDEIALSPPAAGSILNVTQADIPNVNFFPISKVDKNYAWVVTVDSEGVAYVTLGGYDIWPDADGTNGFRTHNL